MACEDSSDCADDEYCIFDEDVCGTEAEGSTCWPKPDAIAGYAVCGCDGVVYESPSHAAIAGQHTDELHRCDTPEGTIACGEYFCDGADGFYCDVLIRECGTIYSCKSIPEECSDAPDCECLGESDGSVYCSVDDNGYFTVEFYAGACPE
jgi:hypothetical protein